MSAIIQFILALPGLVSAIKELVNKIAAWLKERAQSKRSDGIDKAVEDYKSRGPSQEEASNAACKVEKVLNPGSDCDQP